MEETQENLPQKDPDNKEKDPKIGSLGLVAVVVVVLIILGVIYYQWPSEVKEEPLTDTERKEIVSEIEDEPDMVSEKLQQQSDSDELEIIEDDLELSDFEELDKELEDIELELNF